MARAPDLVTALEGQLGLKLESTQGPLKSSSLMAWSAGSAVGGLDERVRHATCAAVLPLVTVARVIPRIEHGRPPDMALRLGCSRQRPGGCRTGRFRKALSVRGVAPRDVQGVVCGNPARSR
jgi:hypothetical protein